ncbi:MAG TPA: response regulator transcription factor [Myxococcaceae bacterium]|nr:response regulator transcription factor [Myxococcaceae bacterium]
MPTPKGPILIVDDDAFVRTLLREMLADQGHPLREAENGQEALDLEGPPPRVVLLDLLMPEMSGMEALALIRSRWPGTPVLVISSMDSDRLVNEALAAGASGYITKPFHPVEIASAVERVLAA